MLESAMHIQILLPFLYVPCIVLALWTILRHKLSRLPPGPRGLPLLGYFGRIPQRTPWNFFTDLSKIYGDVYSLHILGRPVIVLNSFEAINTILIKRSAKYAHKPRRRMGELVGLSATLPLMMEPGALFKSTRTHFRREVGPHGISKYTLEMERNARVTLRKFAEDLTCMHLEEHVNRALGALFLEISLGYSTPDGADMELSSFRNVAQFVSHILGGTYALLDQLPFLGHLLRWAPGSALVHTVDLWRDRVAQVAEMSEQLARKDMASGNPSSVVGKIFTSQEVLTPDEQHHLRLLALTVSAGGMLTLQSVMLTFLFAMSRYPEIQRKAQAELDHVLGGSRLPLMSDKANLPYIGALALEILRWVPVAPLISRQAVENDEYMGYLIPKGAIIIANNWAITRDAIVYPNPRHFSPERFFHPVRGICTENSLNPLTYAFGYGKRVCPGLDMAEMVLFINISHILTVFKVSCATGPNTLDTLEPEYDGKLEIRSGGAACRIEGADCILTPRSSDALALVLSSSEF